MQRATTPPRNTKVNFYDDVSLIDKPFVRTFTYELHTRLTQSIPVQTRLFKSLKLWSFYVDLEESIGSVEATKAVYDKIMELKIANAQTIINYAQFLEENKYFEESFKVGRRSRIFVASESWLSVHYPLAGIRARYRPVQLPGSI